MSNEQINYLIGEVFFLHEQIEELKIRVKNLEDAETYPERNDEVKMNVIDMREADNE